MVLSFILRMNVNVGLEGLELFFLLDLCECILHLDVSKFS